MENKYLTKMSDPVSHQFLSLFTRNYNFNNSTETKKWFCTQDFCPMSFLSLILTAFVILRSRNDQVLPFSIVIWSKLGVFFMKNLKWIHHRNSGLYLILMQTECSLIIFCAVFAPYIRLTYMFTWLLIWLTQ